MRDPAGLYELVDERAADEAFAGRDVRVLVLGLTGFIDAGSGAQLARDHLLEQLDRTLVGRFDVDGLHDYRARRPAMLFVEDHWETYEQPRLDLELLRDRSGVPFLLLHGPEPDLHWEAVTEAVLRLVDRFGVTLTMASNAIPMAVPHTRPVGITAHATRPELVAGYVPWVSRVQVPASLSHLVEWRLGRAGRDAMGFAVHVPHYLAQTDYPAAAEALLDAMARAGGLDLPTAALRTAADEVARSVDEQIRESPEVVAVVATLEQQYDALVGARDRPSLLAPEGGRLPSADELGAELERFLAEQTRRDDPPDR